MVSDAAMKKTLFLVVIGLVGFMAWQSGALSGIGGAASIGGAPDVGENDLDDVVSEGLYNYDYVLVNFEARDGAGNAVNPTGYAYDEVPSKWGNEEDFTDDADTYTGTRTVSFAGGSGNETYPAGEKWHYHFALDGYQDAWYDLVVPTTGDLRPVDARDIGFRHELFMPQYDTTAWTSTAINMSVSTSVNASVDTLTDRTYIEASDNQLIDPANIRIANVSINDFSEYFRVILEGPESTAKIDVVASSGSKTSYDPTDNFVFDSDDYPEFDQAVRDIKAYNGQEILLKLEMKGVTNYNFTAVEGDDIMTSGETLLDGITITDQEGSTLIDSVNVSG